MVPAKEGNNITCTGDNLHVQSSRPSVSYPRSHASFEVEVEVDVALKIERPFCPSVSCKYRSSFFILRATDSFGVLDLNLVGEAQGRVSCTLGAPLTVPAGKAARSTSQQDSSGRRRPVTVEEMCITWLYRSTSISFSTLTVPCSATCP